MIERTQSLSLVETVLGSGSQARFIKYAGLALVGTLILTLSAKITVPFWPVPATLQTLALFAIAAAYGSRLAVATVILYLIEGAVGLPVFAGTPEKGIGLAYMVGPTGGYLIGFVVAAMACGYHVLSVFG